MVKNPFSDVDFKYIPAFLLQMINDRILLRQPEKLYELQHSSFAMPPYISNYECRPHMEKMRESYAFVVYFVMTDSLFYFIPIIISTFSLVRCFQELQKSLDFQRRSTGAGADRKGKERLWNLSRSVFALDCVCFLLSLTLIVCFTIYWLIVDSEGIFLFETAHFLNTFFILVVSFCFMARKFGLWLKIFNYVVQHFISRQASGKDE